MLLARLAEVLEDAENELLPETRALLRDLGDEVRRLSERVRQFDREITALAKRMPAARRLMEIPGIGVLTATALAAAVGEGRSSGTAGRWRGWGWCRGSTRRAASRRC